MYALVLLTHLSLSLSLHRNIWVSNVPTGNTRVVEQQDLQVFRDQLSKTEKNPYQFVLHRNKVRRQLPPLSAVCVALGSLSYSIMNTYDRFVCCMLCCMYV